LHAAGVFGHRDATGVVKPRDATETKLFEDSQATFHRALVDRRASIDGKAHLRDVDIARAKGIVPGLAAVGAPHGLQRAIERDELVALGRIAVE
jgi:hypothetical protein